MLYQLYDTCSVGLQVRLGANPKIGLAGTEIKLLPEGPELLQLSLPMPSSRLLLLEGQSFSY